MTVIEYGEIRKILDSRGRESVEVDIYTTNGFGRAAAPSGASTGRYEVVAYPGNSVDRGIEAFEEYIMPQILGYDALYQRDIDKLLHEIDGTDNFSRIGGNVAVATSMAVAKAAADSLGLPLYRYLGGVFSPSMPYPLGNVLGGGKHSIGGTDIQEYLVMAKAKKFRDCAIINAKVHRRVGEVLREKLPGVAIGRGDEGAWNAPLPDLEALDLVISCAREVEEEYGVKIDLGLDVAASHLWRNGKYYYRDRVLTRDEQIEFIAEIVEHYNLRVVEDPLHEDDFEGFARLTDIVGKDTLIVGDDLYVTQSDRIERGTEMGAGNAVLIKPNQVGTLTDTFSAIKKAKKHGFNIIVSHRSGETCDSTIAHIAVAAGAYAIKTGAISGERVAKLNEIMRIEDLEEAW